MKGHHKNFTNALNFIYMAYKLKPGPKPIADSTGEVDRRRRDNKNTPKNNPKLKPSKSSSKK